MLRVQDLHVYYGAIHAVKGVSLEVADGEIVTLIGANGAGKSTVLNTISGLLKPKSGTVEFMGEMIGSMPPNKVVQHGLVQCPEGRRIFARMTVDTRPSSELAQNLEKVYELFPRLKERQKQVGGTLSGGEQQMLAMGRAMMSQPKLLMLDEPSMGLAPLLVEQIFGIIQSLHKAGTTILLVEQNAQMALQVADRAYVLESGAITLSGLGHELLESDSIKKAYLGG